MIKRKIRIFRKCQEKCNDILNRKGFFFDKLRIIILTAKGFKETNFNLWVSTLTYYSLLAFVPILAILFAIARGFGFRQSIEKLVLENFPNNIDLIQSVFSFANNLLESAKGEVIIAGVGIVLLLWSVIKVLLNIEDAFNHIWRIKTSRPIIRRFSDYISILFILPILVLLSSSLSVYLKIKLNSAENYLFFTTLFLYVLKFLPVIFIIMIFTLIYIIMPNTKVKLITGVVAGIVAGIIYIIFQRLFIESQIFLVKYGKIYGTFSTVPIFLIWMRFNWMIILFGAQISFAIQNVSDYYLRDNYAKVSIFSKKVLIIMIIHYIIENFEAGKKAPTDIMISEYLEIAPELTREITNELVDLKILSKVITSDYNEFAYQPNITTQKITIGFIIDKYETKGDNKIISKPTMRSEENLKFLDKVIDMLIKNEYDILLKDLSKEGINYGRY